MKLYQLDNKNAMRIWEIEVRVSTIIIRHGVLGGKQQEQKEVIKEGLAGRTLQEQVESRVNSRINKQLAKGYRHTPTDAIEFAHANELNLYKPMLAQQFDKQKKVDTNGAVLQRKLDGNRMLVTRSNGDILCYTRNGKPIETLDHIVEQMDWLDEGQTVDGEVYVHGMALKDINSMMRRKQSGTTDLAYHIYDVIDDKPFKERFDLFDHDHDFTSIMIEPYWYYQSEAHTKSIFNSARANGYEGLMMRLDDKGYEPGKRSKSLLKIKYRHDAEYRVIDIEITKEGLGLLVMQLPNGKVVRGTAPGTKREKLHVAENPDQYVGLLCTCSFAYLTEYGIPFHLTCDRWRDE